MIEWFLYLSGFFCQCQQKEMQKKKVIYDYCLKLHPQYLFSVEHLCRRINLFLSISLSIPIVFILIGTVFTLNILAEIIASQTGFEHILSCAPNKMRILTSDMISFSFLLYHVPTLPIDCVRIQYVGPSASLFLKFEGVMYFQIVVESGDLIVQDMFQMNRIFWSDRFHAD